MKNKNLKFKILPTIAVFGLLSIIFTISFSVNAKNNCPQKGSTECVFLTSVSVPAEKTLAASYSEWLTYLYEFLLGFTGIAALFAIVYGGVLYIGSAGNPQQISKAKTWIANAILGLLLAGSSWVILNTINPDLTKGPWIKPLNDYINNSSSAGTNSTPPPGTPGF